MKKCTRCLEIKDKHLFSKNRRKKDGLQSWCKSCKGSYDNKKYHEDNSVLKYQIREANRKKKIELKEYVHQYLMNHSCVDCGESDPVVLEFDHVRETKRYNIAQLIFNTCSLNTLQEEISKCEIRCANCHRRKTARQFSWSKLGL